MPHTIAIDGPVASGKSSLGKQLADRLGYLFFDTGLLYRALTFLALRDQVALDDPEALGAYAQRTPVDVRPATVPDGRDCTVLAGAGEDITWELRAPAVEDNVSRVAAVPAVRQTLTAQMRRIGLRGGVVMVGRDVGTVILPEAERKIFLTASVEARARRRFAEAQARGETRTFADILANLKERDRIDSSRLTAPLRPAADARVIDTTELDPAGALARIEAALHDAA